MKGKHCDINCIITDIWRARNPTTRKYTWVSNTTPPIRCRLDFFITSESITNRVRNCDIRPGYHSDHSTITLDIELETPPRGKGLWKCNAELLKEDDFKDLLVTSIEDIVKNNSPCGDRLLWDTIKCTLRGSIIKYAIK